MKTDDGCVLFLSSPSPGRVLRFIERRCAPTPDARAALIPFDLRLSDPVGAGNIRALIANPDALDWLRQVAPLFVPVFGHTGTVTLLHFSAERWGYSRWQTETAEPETWEETAPSAPTGVFSRWRKPNTALARAAAWGRAHDLPVDRVPALTRARIPVIDYVTIAILDQRSLLAESGPKLYRFDFGG